MHLRCHKIPNYKKLLKPQQYKLRDWRKKTNEGNGVKVKAMNPNTKFNNDTKNSITYAVNKRVTERMKALDQEKGDGKEVESYIMIIIQKSSGKQKASVSDPTRSTTTIIIPGTLNGIIK